MFVSRRTEMIRAGNGWGFNFRSKNLGSDAIGSAPRGFPRERSLAATVHGAVSD
jgi:hypothetical protein